MNLNRDSYFSYAINHEGTQIAYCFRDDDQKIKLYRRSMKLTPEIELSEPELLYSGNDLSIDTLVFNEDSSKIYFSLKEDLDTRTLCWIAADQRPTMELNRIFGPTNCFLDHISFLPTLNEVIFCMGSMPNQNTTREIWIASLNPSGSCLFNPRQLTANAEADTFPIYSPGSGYIYWEKEINKAMDKDTNESCKKRIYRMRTDGQAKEIFIDSKPEHSTTPVSFGTGLFAFAVNDNESQSIRLFTESGRELAPITLEPLGMNEIILQIAFVPK
ncbi:MAG: hypothetical protein ABIK28_07275 [Planctomycetota bacterium]